MTLSCTTYAKERARARKWEQVVERLARGEEEISLDVLPKDESVQVVEMMEALVENRNEIHVVNVPNQGAIDNLPHEAIVEVSSLVGGYGIQPIHVGALREPVAATLRQHITLQELTVEAALTGDRHALQAFLHDPQIASIQLETDSTLTDPSFVNLGRVGGLCDPDLVSPLCDAVLPQPAPILLLSSGEVITG